MVRLCLLALLALACTVLAKGRDGHTHHHYYKEVTNNIHHHRGGGDAHHKGGRKDDHHDDDDDDHHDEDDHAYRFHISGDEAGPYAYLDDQGHLQGAYIDLMNSVCKRAGKRCYYIQDDQQRCWKTKGEEEHPGFGLLLGAYDGCIGLSPTPERRNSFTFTKPFMRRADISFYFNAGKVPEIQAKPNLTSHNIGFVNGWSLSPKCIRRHKDLFSGMGFNPKFYETHKDLVEGLHHDEVEAIFTGDFVNAEVAHIEQGGPVLHCSEEGLAVMAHYGNKMVKWWNDALDELVEEFGWKALCAKATEKHGSHGDLYCPEE